MQFSKCNAQLLSIKMCDYCDYCIFVLLVFLQYFDTVGWVF